MEKPERMQWHPAFASALRLELQEYEHVLDIQEEVQLTRKPLEIDILIIRKKRDVPILKNIAEIFREHNIVEYKSPEDYFSIATFRCKKRNCFPAGGVWRTPEGQPL